MKASPLVALTSAIILIGCVGYGRPETPIAVEYLDGNYISRGTCRHAQTHEWCDASCMGAVRMRGSGDEAATEAAYSFLSSSLGWSCCRCMTG